MGITIDGAGTITGISSGGLNDDIITDDELNLSANASNVKTALNASGTAPIYACRAWCNFNGTGTVAIRASGNVTGITDNGTGNYTINFTTAMPDNEYAVAGFIADGTATAIRSLNGKGVSHNTSSIQVFCVTDGNASFDGSIVSVAIFR